MLFENRTVRKFVGGGGVGIGEGGGENPKQ